MEILTASVLTEVSVVLEYNQIMKKLIKQNYILNIFTNYQNPCRLFILLIKMLKTFEANTESMKIDLNILQEEIEAVMLQIIDDTDNSQILRNWLFDEFAEGLKVIDFLAQMNLLKILNHNKIAKIVEQIWTGNYDQRKLVSIVQTIKVSKIGEAYRKLNINLDTLTTVVSKKDVEHFYIIPLKCYLILLKMLESFKKPLLYDHFKGKN